MVVRTSRAKVVASASSCDRKRWKGQADPRRERRKSSCQVAPSTGDESLTFSGTSVYDPFFFSYLAHLGPSSSPSHLGASFALPVLDATRCTLAFQRFDCHALGSCSHSHTIFAFESLGATWGLGSAWFYFSLTRPKLVAAHSSHRSITIEIKFFLRLTSTDPVPLFGAFSVHTLFCFSPLYEISLLSCLDFLCFLTFFFGLAIMHTLTLLFWIATDGINQVESYEIGYETGVKPHDGDDETP